jgi:hypothetical protein
MHVRRRPQVLAHPLLWVLQVECGQPVSPLDVRSHNAVGELGRWGGDTMSRPTISLQIDSMGVDKTREDYSATGMLASTSPGRVTPLKGAPVPERAHGTS